MITESFGIFVNVFEASAFCYICVLSVPHGVCMCIRVQGSFTVIIEAWHDNTDNGPSQGIH